MRDIPEHALALLGSSAAPATIGVMLHQVAGWAAQQWGFRDLLSQLFSTAAESGMAPNQVNVLEMLADVWEGSGINIADPYLDSDVRRNEVLMLAEYLRLLTCSTYKSNAQRSPTPQDLPPSPSSAGKPVLDINPVGHVTHANAKMHTLVCDCSKRMTLQRLFYYQRAKGYFELNSYPLFVWCIDVAHTSAIASVQLCSSGCQTLLTPCCCLGHCLLHFPL